MDCKAILKEESSRTETAEMDTFTTFSTGKIFVAVGLILLGAAVYACAYFSIFCITEVIAATLVVVWGICLLVKSSKMKQSFPEDEETGDRSGRISPFYYELDPVAMRRDLPPIPRDIGREYDPVILDKV